MKRLYEIRCRLVEVRDREAIRLFRLSRNAAAHGCSDQLCSMIRMEAFVIQRMDPEQLLNPFSKWNYAFKFGRE